MSTSAYRSDSPAPRDAFAQQLRAEWTKFRTVRGWVIGTLFAALLIVLFGYLATFRHQDGGICVGPNPAAGTCQSYAHPTPPIGPNGTPVYDTYAFANRTLTGDGSITVRVGALTGLQQGGGKGHSTSIQDMVGAPAAVQPWAKAGLILTASNRPGAAYAAVMLTGAHGVRMQSDYTYDTAGPGASARWLRLTRSGTTLTGYASNDGAHWTRVGSTTIAGLPRTVHAGLFVTSPPTAPTQLALVPGQDGQATGATATFGQPRLQGGWSSGGWVTRDVNDNGLITTVGAVGFKRSQSGLTITGSGDIGPAVGAGYTDRQALTGVFVGLIALIVLAVVFITGEYRRGLIRTTLTANPHRGHVLLAKALVIAAVAFVVGAAAATVSIPIGNHLLRANGNYVYPAGTLTELRVILGTGALVALAAVLALSLGTAMRRGAGAVTAAIVVIVVPYMLAFASALPAGVSDWLMRITPAAGFAIQQTLPRYHQVSYLYTPSEGFFPLAPGVGLAVLGAYTLIALVVAHRLLGTRDA